MEGRGLEIVAYSRKDVMGNYDRKLYCYRGGLDFSAHVLAWAAVEKGKKYAVWLDECGKLYTQEVVGEVWVRSDELPVDVQLRAAVSNWDCSRDWLADEFARLEKLLAPVAERLDLPTHQWSERAEAIARDAAKAMIDGRHLSPPPVVRLGVGRRKDRGKYSDGPRPEWAEELKVFEAEHFGCVLGYYVPGENKLRDFKFAKDHYLAVSTGGHFCVS